MKEKKKYDLLVHNIGTLVTCGGHEKPAAGSHQAEAGILNNVSIAVADGKIALIAPQNEVLDLSAEAEIIIDAANGVVTPGFVDPHTHLVYAGNRAHEYELKLQGVPYLEILRQGGGILSTVNQTRSVGKEEMKRQSQQRLRTMLRHGTTTAEVKTGYGLNTVTELLQLEIIEELALEQAIELVPTFMAAHAVPPEYKEDRAAYIELIVEEMLPLVGQRVRFCDVFCETGVFTPEESHTILAAGRCYGLTPKIHADELAASGGSLLAAELKAISADHLLRTEEEGMAALAAAGVIGVCLPATSFNLAEGHYAPARRMLEHGMALALATDANPGSSPTENMQLVLSIACLYLKMTPAEALVAATINAAHAIGVADKVGSIEVGKQADLLIFHIPSLAYLPYHFGVNQVQTVIKKGHVV